jgi:hypothetical protein
VANPEDPRCGKPAPQAYAPASFPTAGASPPTAPRQLRTAGEPTRARRNVGLHHHANREALREPVFLALIMVLAAAAGWILIERLTDLPPPKRYSGFELDIGSPTQLPHYAPTFDSAGQLRVTSVEYIEDHGGTPDYFPYEGGIEAHIGVRFDRPVVGDAPVQVVLELPAPVGHAYVSDCRPSSPIEPLDANCSVERLPEYAAHRDALVMRGILHGQAPPLAQDTVQSFGFTVHLSNIDGVGFRTSRTRVEAGFPTVPVLNDRTPAGDLSEESVANGDDAVHVQYWIPGAGQMTWSGLPPIRVGDNAAEWRSRSNSWNVQSSSSGTRDDLISMKSRYTFVAGVLLGVAGGALIPFVRALSALPAVSRGRKSPR